MSKNILVISVHPDDETLGCGGTMLKHKASGDNIHWLILTKANPKITAIKNILQLQNDYIRLAAKAYNFDTWEQLDFITTELEAYATGDLVRAISDSMVKVMPEVVYCNHFSDIHTDHQTAFSAIMSCTKNFRAPYVKRILSYETLSETEFAPATQVNAFVPNVFNDITPYFQKKIKIMKLFTTELMDEPLPRAFSTIEALARFRGSRIGVKYAESFMLLFEQS